MTVLVVGGAGYIGSHAVRHLKESGRTVVVFDNLSMGHRSVCDRLGVPLVVGDLLDPASIQAAFKTHAIDAVMHFAASAYVGESVTHPDKYYRNNVVGSLNLVDAMRSAGVGKLIFSSTCATYGDPTTPTLDETHPQAPVNPYGWSKLMVEQILRDYGSAFGLRSVCLRYFNASGSSPDGLIGEDHDPETHLLPLCLQAALGRRSALTVFGRDYPTPDGTCIRDYIHVDDLASAHRLALEHLDRGGVSLALNVGVGQGYSVQQVIDCCEEVTGLKVPIVDGPRRPGDPPSLVANAQLIRRQLGWTPKYTRLDAIIETAWPWFQAGGSYNEC